MGNVFIRRGTSHILYLHNDDTYAEALNIVEYLMELVERPENLLINLLEQAIKEYESCDDDIISFEQAVSDEKPDVSMLRFIIDQNKLTLSDLPEIGHKSLVSKILFGTRHLTKSHIQKLCHRFNLDPSLFF